MSLKYRRYLQNQTERDEEGGGGNVYEERVQRIWAPIVWKRLESGIVIQTLRSDRFADALKMFKEDFIGYETLARNAEILSERKSLKTYLNTLHYLMRDNKSIVAMSPIYNPVKKETTWEMAGALILSVIFKDECTTVYHRVRIQPGKNIKKLIAINNLISRKADVFEIFNCDRYLQIHYLCIRPSFRHQGIGFQMLQCSMDCARCYKCPVVMGMFSAFVLQGYARRLGLRGIYEIGFANWLDADGEYIFDDPGLGNYTLTMMAGNVPVKRAKKTAAPT